MGSHWLLRGHITSNNKTVSRQNLSAGNLAKSITPRANSALLPVNVNQRVLLQQGLMNLQLCIITDHLKTGPSGNSKFCFS